MVRVFEVWIAGEFYCFVDNLNYNQKMLLISYLKAYCSENIFFNKEMIEKLTTDIYTFYGITLEQVEITDVITIK